MREHLISSFKISLEWRLIAFVITYLFLLATTGEFWQATWSSFVLQFLLFVAHMMWVFIRHPLTSGFKRKTGV